MRIIWKLFNSKFHLIRSKKPVPSTSNYRGSTVFSFYKSGSKSVNLLINSFMQVKIKTQNLKIKSISKVRWSEFLRLHTQKNKIEGFFEWGRSALPLILNREICQDVKAHYPRTLSWEYLSLILSGKFFAG